jgi:hypothetical protein
MYSAFLGAEAKPQILRIRRMRRKNVECKARLKAWIRSKVCLAKGAGCTTGGFRVAVERRRDVK